jgi:3-methyladenine DNA glycosylase AlkD
MHKYVTNIKLIFDAKRDPKNAIPMAKYMKHEFEFLGIKTPVRRDLLKEFHKQDGFPEITELKEIVLDLWGLPAREYQYFALSLLRKFSQEVPEEFIDLYEYLIITKSWWDSVDGIASWLVGVHFLRFPELKNKYIGKWMTSGNMWLQRTCILFQLGYKDKTDVMLLGQIIMSVADSKEFFLRKAIGWALREYSKTDHQAVINFVENNELSLLSNREAYKWMQKKDLI